MVPVHGAPGLRPQVVVDVVLQLVGNNGGQAFRGRCEGGQGHVLRAAHGHRRHRGRRRLDVVAVTAVPRRITQHDFCFVECVSFDLKVEIETKS